MKTLKSVEQDILDDLLKRRPDLVVCVEGLLALHAALVRCYDAGGTLFLCGNGGSMADAMHIAGELCKSFERKRPVQTDLALKLQDYPLGNRLAQHLEVGLRAVTLGLNASLKTAVENDSPLRDVAFAQEAFALVRPGDVLMGISTSGNADNCLMALSVAKAVGAVAVSLTGPDGGRMAEFVDIAVKAPGASTKVIQEAHEALYHTSCAMIEAHYFPESR
ncbi:MAG TPA: SIS domain-containing protein [Candidatus Hydrogenedentes bacterium]|nr:SIS domain-containing protein [Candidatus Hydrogenedentota bacterium]